MRSYARIQYAQTTASELDANWSKPFHSVFHNSNLLFARILLWYGLKLNNVTWMCVRAGARELLLVESKSVNAN